MKITALIPDDLIEEVRKHTGGHNTTECLIIALSQFISHKKIVELNKKVTKKPLEFNAGFSATKVRTRNRQS